jgi:hypothetical protein
MLVASKLHGAKNDRSNSVQTTVLMHDRFRENGHEGIENDGDH